MGRQSNLTLEQRTEAVLSLLRREEPAATIARHAGRGVEDEDGRLIVSLPH